jgi:hypothetical protein
MLLSRVTRALPYNLDGTATAIGELSTHTHILNLKLTSNPRTVEKNWDDNLNLIQILLGQGKRTTIQLQLQMMLDNACPPQALLAGTGWRTLNRSLAHHPRPSQTILSTTAYLHPTTSQDILICHGNVCQRRRVWHQCQFWGILCQSPSQSADGRRDGCERKAKRRRMACLSWYRLKRGIPRITPPA